MKHKIQKRLLFLLVMCMSAVTVSAAEITAKEEVQKAEESPGRLLSAAEIKLLLQDATAFYADGARQFFAAGGRTDYQDSNGGQTSGSWRISGNKYCSTWAPGGSSCYTITRHDDSITIPIDDISDATKPHDDNATIPILRWNGEYEAKIYPGNLMDK